MKRKMTLVAVLLPLLAACADIRPYDGVIGYQARKDTTGNLTIVYRDEDRLGWEVLEKKARMACMQELSLPASAVKTEVLTKSQESRAIPVALLVPVGMSSDGTPSKSSAGNGQVQMSVIQDQTATRLLKLKTLTTGCAPL